MSCYNAEKWLSEAIDSVLSQTYEDFELILVDDGSQDNTIEIIRQYEKLDDRIKVISKVNTGLPDSLNIGIFAAQGQWIARLDADDICERSRLENQLDFVRENPQVVLLGSGFSEIDVNSNFLKAHRYPTKHFQLEACLRSVQRFFPHSSAFYPTEIVKKIGGYRSRIRLAEDRDLWLRLSETGRLACLDRPLVRIRRHPDQISHQDSARNSTIDAMCATVSYFLRTSGAEDPVETENEANWRQFREWIETCIDRQGILQNRKSSIATQDKFRSQDDRLITTLGIVRDLFFSSYMIDIIKQKLFAPYLPKYLAKEWQRSPTNWNSNNRS